MYGGSETRTGPVRVRLRLTTGRWGEEQVIECVKPILTPCRCVRGMKGMCDSCYVDHLIREFDEDAFPRDQWTDITHEEKIVTVCAVDSESETLDGKDYDSWIEEYVPPEQRAKT